MKISEFKKGDIITRVKPTLSLSYVGVGVKLEYVGNLNGCVYFKLDGYNALMYMIEDLVNDNHWEYYVDPYSLLKEENLEEQISKALEEENYELAQMLKRKLDE